MKVIFLDIDGVLNTSMTSVRTKTGFTFIEPQYIERLKRLVEESGASIILSSTWRQGMIDIENEDMDSIDARDYLELEAFFQKYGLVISGHTPESYGFCSYRGSEIRMWLLEHDEVTDFVILDDRDDMAPYMDYLVHIDPCRGLTGADVSKALKVLGRVAEREER